MFHKQRASASFIVEPCGESAALLKCGLYKFPQFTREKSSAFVHVRGGQRDPMREFLFPEKIPAVREKQKLAFRIR